MRLAATNNTLSIARGVRRWGTLRHRGSSEGSLCTGEFRELLPLCGGGDIFRHWLGEVDSSSSGAVTISCPAPLPSSEFN